jgi:hypothetical protein
MKDWLNFEYSNKEVTAHGGMSLLKRFFDKAGECKLQSAGWK